MSHSKIVHPIFNTSEFFVKTPMATQLNDQLNAWLQNGATGAIITGPYRCGKSRAIEYSSDRLINRLSQSIPAHILTIHRRDAKTIKSIFKNLCLSLSLIPKPRSNTDDLSDLVFHHFCDLADQNDTKQVVLFIDEVHRLTLEQLEAFCEIYDKLVKAHINISVFFIGNENASANLLRLISLKENELIRGRFFVRRTKFTGLRNQMDVRKTLMQYDNMVFPMPDGQSYTAHFTASKCGKAFRLSDLSDVLWDVFRNNYRSQLNVKAWQMQYFLAVVQMLLVDYLPKYGAENEAQIQEFIYEGIATSGLVASLVEAA